jgi:hypothetical protein
MNRVEELLHYWWGMTEVSLLLGQETDNRWYCKIDGVTETGIITYKISENEKWEKDVFSIIASECEEFVVRWKFVDMYIFVVAVKNVGDVIATAMFKDNMLLSCDERDRAYDDFFLYTTRKEVSNKHFISVPNERTY